MVVGKQLADAAADCLTGLVGQIGQRDAHRHGRPSKAGAVEHYDAALFRQAHDEIERPELRDEPCGKSSTVARARERRDIDHRVVVSQQRSARRLDADAHEQPLEAPFQHVSRSTLTNLPFIEQGIEREERHLHLLRRR